ncbi:hypothetical protein A2U01_0036422, partial [Trifolium medium]|nr:hypothetical protein [Trifolium medium]
MAKVEGGAHKLTTRTSDRDTLMLVVTPKLSAGDRGRRRLVDKDRVISEDTTLLLSCRHWDRKMKPPGGHHASAAQAVYGAFKEISIFK